MTNSITEKYFLRSILYVPGHREDLINKSLKTNADVIAFDLEDSVPAELKYNARNNINAFKTDILNTGKRMVVRINSDQENLLLDAQAVVDADIDIIIVPKVDNAQQIQNLAHLLSEIGNDHIAIIAMIESPVGLLNAKEIADAHPSVIALCLGSEDFSLEMGMEPSWDSLLFPSQQILLAAKASGKIALGCSGSIAEFKDIDLFSSIAKRSAKLGFDGGFAIHPRQIEPLNEAFFPTESEIELAHRIVVAFDEAIRNGNGAISVDGKMIDLPVANRAKATLERIDGMLYKRDN